MKQCAATAARFGLVFLPFEAHGYRAKETIEDVLYEKFAWFDKYVKNAPAVTTSSSSGQR